MIVAVQLRGFADDDGWTVHFWPRLASRCSS